MKQNSVMSRTALNYFSLVFAGLLIVGETVVVMTDPSKPLALSLDDYLVASGLLVFAWRPFSLARLGGLLASWFFACGGLWVMLVYRMPPLGEGERLAVLVAAFVLALLGAVWTASRFAKHAAAD